MILRDTVEALDNAGTVLAKLRGQVSYRTVTLDVNPGGGGGFQVEQQLVALTDPWEWELGKHKLRFRGEDYTITGLLWRRRNGRDHHVTVNLEKISG